MACNQARLTIALYGPKFSTTKNNTCHVIGLALTRRKISPTVSVVAPLNPDKVLLDELRWSSGIFIYWKAGRYNKSDALLGSTRTLRTSKLLIHKVSISAS